MCDWWRDRDLNHWNRIENPDREPQQYAQQIFDKGMGFSTNVGEASGYPMGGGGGH